MQFVEAGRDYTALEGHLAQFVEYAATLAESALAPRRRELRQAAAINPRRLETASQAWRCSAALARSFGRRMPTAHVAARSTLATPASAAAAAQPRHET